MCASTASSGSIRPPPRGSRASRSTRPRSLRRSAPRRAHQPATRAADSPSVTFLRRGGHTELDPRNPAYVAGRRAQCRTPFSVAPPRRIPMRKPDSANRVVTIAVACLATAMLMLDISVINTALSKIAHGLDTGLGGLQWVVDAYTIPLAATVLTAGAIADRIGRRRLFLLGLSIFTVSSALCGAASGIEVLVASRAVQGLGAAL